MNSSAIVDVEYHFTAINNDDEEEKLAAAPVSGGRINKVIQFVVIGTLDHYYMKP